MVVEGFALVQRDGVRLGVTSTVLLMVVLLFCFRSVRWTLIPLAIVHWSIIVTQAILVLLNLELTLVSSMLTAIVTVIGVATTMHLLLRYQDTRRRGTERVTALRESLAALVVPIALACLTDAVGFISLMAANVGPVRDFGLIDGHRFDGRASVDSAFGAWPCIDRQVGFRSSCSESGSGGSACVTSTARRGAESS